MSSDFWYVRTSWIVDNSVFLRKNEAIDINAAQSSDSTAFLVVGAQTTADQSECSAVLPTFTEPHWGHGLGFGNASPNQ